jgi:hypothetical protein
VSLKLDLDAPPLDPAGPRDRARPPSRPGRSRTPTDSRESWWTARATAGQVTAGFSRDEILRRPEGDPRAAGGAFSRVAALLEALDAPG